MQSERQRQKQQYHILKDRYLGVGNESTTPDEWLENVQRDTYYSMQAHSSMLEYISLAKNGAGVSKRMTQLELLKKMCVNPGKRELEDSEDGEQSVKESKGNDDS